MTTPRSHVVTLSAADYPVKEATVYCDRAEVSRPLAGIAAAAHGTTEVRLRGVSTSLAQDSIRIDVDGPVVIADVQFKSYQEEITDTDSARDSGSAKPAAEVAQHRAAAESLRTELASLADQALVAEAEHAALDKFASTLVAPPTTTRSALAPAPVMTTKDTSAVLADFLPKYVERAEALLIKAAELKREIAEKERARDKENAWLRQHDPKFQSESGRRFREVASIVVILEPPKSDAANKDPSASPAVSSTATATETVPVNLIVSYSVDTARWIPHYDLRVSSHRAQVQVTYAAKLNQNSGDDWKDTDLILSTASARDNAGGKAPEFTAPWMIHKVNPQAYFSSMSKRKTAAPGGGFGSYGGGGGDDESRMMMDEDSDSDGSDWDGPTTTTTSVVGGFGSASKSRKRSSRGGGVQSATTSSGAVAALFGLPVPISVATGTEGKRVSVARVELPVTMVHETVPKLSPVAYLIGTATNKSEYTFLAGEANVFLDGSYICKSEMPLVQPGATFSMTLGVDPSVAVTYKPIERITETGKPSSLLASLTGSHGPTTAVQGRLTSVGPNGQPLPVLADGDRRAHCTHRTVVENKSATKIATVTVRDQAPVAASARITVALVEPADAKLPVFSTAERFEGLKAKGGVEIVSKKGIRDNGVRMFADTGVIEWSLTIPPATKHEVVLAYRVEWPKGFDMTKM
ncbi:hypothetical protein BC828DRAFT_390610 [Blastocladiella britannica]|nr:hypothetical protein BC828DRAFT_390610 [Blastocladiella britannica]